MGARTAFLVVFGRVNRGSSGPELFGRKRSVLEGSGERLDIHRANIVGVVGADLARAAAVVLVVAFVGLVI